MTASPPTSNQPPVAITFARDLRLIDATMIGLGAMMGAGVFVLPGVVAQLAGESMWLVMALGGAVALLTVFSYAELLAADPRAGGSHAFIRKAYPGPVGFVGSWMLWFSYVITCSLYAKAFAAYLWRVALELAPRPVSVEAALPLTVASVAVGVLLIAINMRGSALAGRPGRVLGFIKMSAAGLLVVAGMVALAMNTDGASAPAQVLPHTTKSIVHVALAVGLVFVAFAGCDLIAMISDEVHEPARTVPRAMLLSLGAATVVYVLVMLTFAAARDASDSDSMMYTAVVEIGGRVLPWIGVSLMIAGGLAATLTALNAMMLASTRVVFVLSGDRLLPRWFGRLHPKHRTPHLAVAVNGAIMIVLLLALPIEVIASTASVTFLLVFAMVNLSLIVMRRQSTEKPSGFRTPLYPLLPVMAIGLNLGLAGLQFAYDFRSWLIPVLWALAGFAAYQLYFRRVVAPWTPQVLEVEHAGRARPRAFRMLIPLHNPDHVIPLLDLAMPIAQSHDGEIIVLGVINVPQNIPIQEGRRFVEEKMPLMQQAVRYGWEHGVPTHSSMRIANRVHDGILRAAEDERASLILMGWRGQTTATDRIFGEVTDRVVHRAPCDLIAVRLDGPLKVGHLLIPTAGGPHALLASEFAALYQSAYGTRVTCCYVVPEGATARDRDEAEEWIDKTIRRTELKATVERKIIESNQIAPALAEAGREADLIIVGASKEGIFSSVLFGEIPERIARSAATPVMIVKRYEGVVKSMVKKVLG